MAEVVLTRLSKSFSKHRVVDGVNLTIADGEFLSLLGPSGCGKTTTLRMIAGLEDIDSGELYIGGRLQNNIPARARQVAMVFQSYALFPHMSVRANLAFGLKVRKVNKAEALKKIEWVVELMRLEGLEERYPKELSGGQRQRVALGRALVLDPKVLLLDEPLSNLDPELRDRMTAELKRLHRQIGKTIIYVTHNQIEAMTLSNRIAIMEKGRIIQCDTPVNTYNFPSCEFVARFIGSPPMNLFNAMLEEMEGKHSLLLENGARLKLDSTFEEKARPYIGQPVLIGLRPQHIYHQLAKVGRRHSDTRVSVSVDIVEPLGEKNLVVSKFGAIPLVFLVDPDIELGTDQEMPVVIDGRKLHFFHPVTKERLFV